MPESIFTVQPAHLTRIGPSDAVDLFRKLLWAEAERLKISTALINVPSAITVPDGGVDAEVRDVTLPAGEEQGVIREGLTRYQIKTGPFTPNNTNISDILFNSAGDLKPRIKTCLDNGGTLAIVLFGWDNPEQSDDMLISRARELLAALDSKYRSARIVIWQQNHLMSFLSKFPSLCLDANGNSHTHFKSHKSWGRDATMSVPLKLGAAQETFVESLQAAMRAPASEAVHVRVHGEAGIGKTRLALEATRTDDLSPLVLYCPSATSFLGSDLFNLLLRDDNIFLSLLVVDECSLDQMSEIWRQLKANSKVKLITIFNEFDTVTGMNVLDVEILEKEKIVEIIKSYGVLPDGIDRFADLCDGYPRVAHCIGENLRDNPADPLQPTATRADIWTRFIAGSQNLSDSEVEMRFVVLRYLALFKRFGYCGPVKKEAKAIASLVEQADPRITWSKFQEIISHLKERKVLQGETTLYLTPKALHIWLWTEWWRRYGTAFNMGTFLDQLPQDTSLQDWFNEMFKYAAQSEAAADTVKELLGLNGVFKDE